MFDSTTAKLLQSAPAVPGLDPQSIPALLTRHYANLVSARLRGETAGIDEVDERWPLDRIADTYELAASLQTESRFRRASAFVAGTAQQIIARRELAAAGGDIALPNIDRTRVDPAIAATVLFLAAEQYADANEAASAIRPRQQGQLFEATILSEHISDLARGRLTRILERAERWRRPNDGRELEERALASLLETLITGLEMLAARFLGLPLLQPSADRFESSRVAFEHVLRLSAGSMDYFGVNILHSYAGPHHLASLLIAADDGLADASLVNLPPPVSADPEFWQRWLEHRARSCPFIWPNHREAIGNQFHQTGKSAVVVLPTGAGKTTVSALKIAGTLARGKKVVFLAPTHALVEQLTEDLQEMFPKDVLGSVVSSDFDLLFQDEAQLQEIEVMTPERCLAMLSFASEAFSEVGLLVFDECHLLGPQSGKVRRALDGMLCVLGFNHIVPSADLLFLSAMLKNGQEFAEWIGQLTSRDCVSVDLLWKPSRQARGVLIYRDEELREARKRAAAVQAAENKKKKVLAKGLRSAARRELVACPWAIWGLQHNWLGKNADHWTLNKVLDKPVVLSGLISHGRIRLTPNANHVAASLAVAAAKNGLKSIVFVNTKHDAVSVANRIASELNGLVEANEAEQVRWAALEAELGDLKHALLPQPQIAVPHNASMLRLERDLAERMFKSPNGAKVIVATPTLAQGLNLPAHLAILAGDKRSDTAQQGREQLEAHEILNAAARAGRAGHLANGVVLLIPEPNLTFLEKPPLKDEVIQKLKSVLPEDDRCVVVTDPVEIVLDRLMEGQALDIDVRYLVNRMAALRETDGRDETIVLFDLRKSLGAFAAQKRQAYAEFEAKIFQLKKAIAQDAPNEVDNTIAVLASQSGLPMDLLLSLKKRIVDQTDSLPVTVEDWVIWTINWLADDDYARMSLLYDVKRSVLGACGAERNNELSGEVLKRTLPGLLAWVRGTPLSEMEKALGGDPESDLRTKQSCPRARELVGTVIPRGFSFTIGLVSHVVEEIGVFKKQNDSNKILIECLTTAVRRGLDLPEKVLFSSENPKLLSRVQVHKLWAQQNQSSAG